METYLTGEHFLKVDEKGRVFIPAKVREVLKNKGFDYLVLTRSLDNAIFVFFPDAWEELQKKLATLPFANPKARAFKRFILAPATECQLDNQGRILLPQSLREYAGIKNEAILIGLSDRMEIWEPGRWKEYCRWTADNISSIAEEVGDFGL